MAGWSQNRRGSGIWKLTARLPSSSVHVWFLHDDGGRHRVMMMEMPFGAHPVAVIEGGHKALRESSSGGLADPTAGAHSLTCCVVARARPWGTHSCLKARRARATNPWQLVQRASFRPDRRGPSERVSAAWAARVWAELAGHCHTESRRWARFACRLVSCHPDLLTGRAAKGSPSAALRSGSEQGQRVTVLRRCATRWFRGCLP